MFLLFQRIEVIQNKIKEAIEYITIVIIVLLDGLR
jgi:hypothetical protein